MTRKNRTRLTSVRLHKPSGRGFVELNGERIYLGNHDDPKVHQKYLALVGEWVANGREIPVAQEEITVSEVCAAYRRHALDYYRRPDGSTTQTVDMVKQTMKPRKELYGDSPASEFGPKALRAIQEGWIAKGLSRTTVNHYTRTAKRLVEWAVSHEIVPPHVYQGLVTVKGLRAGRSAAKENPRIEPVPDSHIDAIRPHLPRQLNALVSLQLLTGTRAGESICTDHFVTGAILATDSASWKDINPRVRCEAEPPRLTPGQQFSQAPGAPVTASVPAAPEPTRPAPAAVPP